MEATIVLDGHEFHVRLFEEDGRWRAEVDGKTFHLQSHGTGLRSVVHAGDDVFSIDARHSRAPRIDGREADFNILSLKGVAGAPDPSAGAHGPVRPPMTGKLDAILVEPGQEVRQGDVLFVLEAMKMRNEIKAAADGVIGTIHGVAGDAVDSSQPVLELLPPSSSD